jgi:hypothetical protein
MAATGQTKTGFEWDEWKAGPSAYARLRAGASDSYGASGSFELKMRLLYESYQGRVPSSGYNIMQATWLINPYGEAIVSGVLPRFEFGATAEGQRAIAHEFSSTSPDDRPLSRVYLRGGPYVKWQRRRLGLRLDGILGYFSWNIHDKHGTGFSLEGSFRSFLAKVEYIGAGDDTTVSGSIRIETDLCDLFRWW